MRSIDDSQLLFETNSDLISCNSSFCCLFLHNRSLSQQERWYFIIIKTFQPTGFHCVKAFSNRNRQNEVSVFNSKLLVVNTNFHNSIVQLQDLCRPSRQCFMQTPSLWRDWLGWRKRHSSMQTFVCAEIWGGERILRGLWGGGDHP